MDSSKEKVIGAYCVNDDIKTTDLSLKMSWLDGLEVEKEDRYQSEFLLLNASSMHLLPHPSYSRQ